MESIVIRRLLLVRSVATEQEMETETLEQNNHRDENEAAETVIEGDWNARHAR